EITEPILNNSSDSISKQASKQEFIRFHQQEFIRFHQQARIHPIPSASKQASKNSSDSISKNSSDSISKNSSDSISKNSSDSISKNSSDSISKEYLGFIQALNEAVKGKPNSAQCPESTTVTGCSSNVCGFVLYTLSFRLPHKFLPISSFSVVSNLVTRSWIVDLEGVLCHFYKKHCQRNFHRAIPEIMLYLSEGFGNSTRIDYGTGHEMSFLMLLCCLFKIGALLEIDKEAAVYTLASPYLSLCRKLQTTYRMEPAGSHGVWSLDDYQFVPFIWGSAQLIAHPRIEPRSFLQPDIFEAYAGDFLF
ncbi:hypothetical protein L9F63_026929, partial [Diploptera punctata]